VTYKDATSKNDIALKLTDLKTIVKTFDLETNNYAVDYIDAKGFKLIFNQGLLEEVAENVEETVDSLSQNSPLQIAINSLDLQDFDVLYDDENSATRAKVVFDELTAKVKKINLPDSDFDIKKLTIKNAFVDVLLMPDSKAAQAVNTAETDSLSINENPMKVLLQTADLQNVNVVFNNRSEEHTSELQSRENLVCRL